MTATATTVGPTVNGAACVPVDPCEAASYLENAMLQQAAQGGRYVKQVTYEGRTTIWDRGLSLADLKSLLNYYRAKCALQCPTDPAAQGPARIGAFGACAGGIVPRRKC